MKTPPRQMRREHHSHVSTVAEFCSSYVDEGVSFGTVFFRNLQSSSFHTASPQSSRSLAGFHHFLANGRFGEIGRVFLRSQQRSNLPALLSRDYVNRSTALGSDQTSAAQSGNANSMPVACPLLRYAPIRIA